jgi:type I restriction enzyme, S subunit
VITTVSRVTETGGRGATTRHIPPKLALAAGMPITSSPPGWRWVPLTELARLESGHTPSRKHPEYWGGSIPWISIQDARDNDGERIDDTIEHVTQSGITNSSARILPTNTVCLSRTASVGYVVVMGRPMATSQDFVNWVCSPALDHNFLKYLFIAEGEDLLRFASGAVHQTIYFPEAKAFHICLPSLSEQHRIVEMLDGAFEGISVAQKNVEANLRNCHLVFDSHLKSLFNGSVRGWIQRKLGDIAEVQSGGTPSVSRREYWGGSIAWYASGELNAERTSAPARWITKMGLQNSNARIFPKGSLLIGMYDTAALKMSILDREAAFNQAVAGVKPTKELEMEFVRYAIIAKKPELLRQRRGVRQKNLSLGKIKEIVLPVPGIDDQKAALSRLHLIADRVDSLHMIYSRKLAALDELKTSLLHHAFTGQL